VQPTRASPELQVQLAAVVKMQQQEEESKNIIDDNQGSFVGQDHLNMSQQ
jgi:hypothetical protein